MNNCQGGRSAFIEAASARASTYNPHPMQSALRYAAVLLVAIAADAPPAMAADQTGTGYRLSIPQPDAFRLGGGRGSGSKPPISAQLADKPFTEQIHSAARDAALDPALVHAVIHVESGYNPAARSPKGALGLMQVMPETAARYGIRNPARSIEANLSAGTRYLHDLMAMFDGRLELALAAYNAGENAVRRYGHRIPPYRETEHYVPAVLAKYREWQDPPPPRAHRIEYLPGTTLEPTVQPRLRR